ncbi:hypothetical protein [Neorhizobium alkalisoli]|uniref:hypothetical protein n=1 Tax=Neorhizobium alkalisoli TaxID=528178 RepID=UPI000CF9A96D|nr:hypothetical protein [Neorhizobium alkalisoli]
MPSATKRLDDILVNLPKYQSQWQLNIARPYVRAYGDAIDNFNRERSAQAERDRTLAELFVFSASILTGSIMMAAFATTSVRVLAGRGLLSVICNRNLNLTFELMHAAASSKPFMFALGGVLDEAKKLAGNQVKKATESLTSSAPMAVNASAINYMTRISDFIDSNHICVHNFIEGVRDDRSIDEASKSKIADLAKGIPFCNPPSGRLIDEQSLSKKMELLFYMASVLDSDQLIRYAPATGGTLGGMGQDVEYGRTPITQMPSATDYPKAVAPRLKGTPYPHYEPGQRVGYKNIGSGIRDRINVLSMQTGNGRFYPEQNFMAKLVLDPTDKTQIVRAEQIISRLSAEARPRQLTEVRMI